MSKDTVPDAIKRIDLTESLAGSYVLIDVEGLTTGWFKRVCENDTQHSAMAEVICGGETPYPLDLESLINRWPMWKYSALLRDVFDFITAMNSSTSVADVRTSRDVQFVKDNLLLALADPSFVMEIRRLIGPTPLSEKSMFSILDSVSKRYNNK